MIANTAIPSYVDLNIYTGVQIKFQDLSNSPTSNGALIGDALLSCDISSSYSFDTKWGIPGKVLSIMSLILLIIHSIRKKVYAGQNIVFTLQTLYLMAFNLGPTNIESL